MNTKTVIILVLGVGAVTLAIGIFVGRTAAPPLPIQEVSKKEKVAEKEKASEIKKVNAGQEKDGDEPIAKTGFGERLALIQALGPDLPDRLPVTEAPLEAGKAANVPSEPMPRIPLVPAAVERTPLALVKPIRLSGPSGLGPEERPPLDLGHLASPAPTELPLDPGIHPPLRPVRLIGPSSDRKPASETGSLRRLKRPVRERSDQGRLDYLVAQTRGAPAAEDFKSLARFSFKEWSARHSIQPDRVIQVSGKLSTPDSIAGVSLPGRRKSEASSGIPEVQLKVQNRLERGAESIPDLELEEPHSAIRLPIPRPTTESLFIRPRDNPESLVAVSFRRATGETYSLKVARARPEPLKSSRTLIGPVLLSASRSEPTPTLNVFNEWPPLSKFETDFHQSKVEYPLPGLYSPAELKPSKAPAERPRHPSLPLPTINKQL
ncbi:MAG: hypothetical protein QF886_11200 [Planctomycetota bacterium]|jgi:hypothetical protein|nr:hypothetical protein [Planctomycetota bacterium]